MGARITKRLAEEMGLLPMSEETFTRKVIRQAQQLGWRVFHQRPARTKDGWCSAVMGDGAGWPDLVMIRGKRILVAELKVGNNRTSPAQKAWLAAFRGLGVVEVYVWYPKDQPAIERVLGVEDLAAALRAAGVLA